MDLEKNQNEEDWQPKLERFKDFRRTGRSSLLPLVFNCFFTFCYCPYYFIHHAQLNNVVYVLELLFIVLSLVCCWVVWGLFDTTDEVILRWRHRFKSTFTILVTLCFSFHFIVEFGSFGPEKVQEEGEFEFPTSLILLVIVPFKAAEVFRETNDVVLAIQLSIIILTLLLMMILSFTFDTLIIFVAYTVMIVLVRVDRAIFSWTVFDDVVEGKRKEEVKERANLELQKKFAEHTRNALEKRIIEMREMIGNVAHDLKTPLTSFATATEMIESDLQGFITTVNEMTTEYETLLRQLQTHESSRTQFKLRINNLYSKMLGSMNSVRDIHAFMLMMINRSLDFTKASAGITLIPLVESINLSAIISKPLKCVRNIQQRVTIQVNSSLNLCTFIKTDRTWLEENLLCILSNAIKYSTSNTVEVSLSIVTLETLGKTAGRAEDEVMTEKELSSSARANSNVPERNNQRIDRKDKPIEVYNVNPNPVEEEKKSAHRVSSDVWFATKTVRRASRGYALVYPKVGSSEFTTCNSSTSSIDCKGRIPSKSSLNGVNEEDTSQFVLFEVKDTGKKLSMQEMESFFNPFEQQRLSGGTGLGLYSLAKRVEALGGQYGLHEREDGVAGNVVWFTIPYAVDYDSRSDEIKKEDININNVLPFQRDVGSMRTANLLKEEESQKRILIVEDALAISKMTSSMLKRQRFETDIAENGQIAVDKVIRNYERWQSGLERRCDAILMDFQMPVMDGLEATMRIREYEKLHGIKDGCLIIGISAMSDAEKIAAALEIGMNAFIPKPFTCKDFHSYLQDFRQRK